MRPLTTYALRSTHALGVQGPLRPPRPLSLAAFRSRAPRSTAQRKRRGSPAHFPSIRRGSPGRGWLDHGRWSPGRGSPGSRPVGRGRGLRGSRRGSPCGDRHVGQPPEGVCRIHAVDREVRTCRPVRGVRRQARRVPLLAVDGIGREIAGPGASGSEAQPHKGAGRWPGGHQACALGRALRVQRG